jgi:hypothetical protein
MGKKTEEKIDAVKKALTQFGSIVVNVNAGEVKLKEAIAERDALVARHAQYYKAHGWEGQKPTREQEMDNDAAWQKLDTDMRVSYKKAERIENALRAVRGDLRRAGVAARTALADLEKFINEKDKKITDAAKKKSVPAARVFIKEVHAVVG